MTSLPISHADLAVQRANQRGILLMIGAMAAFLANDTFAKLATAAMPVSEIMAIRGAFASLFVLALIFANGLGQQFRRVLQWPVGLRGCLEVAVAFTSILGLSHVAIGTSTTIGQVTPLILLALSVVILKERADWKRWLAVIVSFGGVVLVAHPTAAGLNLFVLATLASAVLTAFRDLLTQRMGSGIPTLLATFGTIVIVSLAGFCGCAVETWQPLDLHTLLILLLGALCLTGGHTMVIAAYRGVEVSVVSPFRYSAIAMSVIAGLAVFGELPDVWAGIGMMLIVISGLATAHREMRRRRAVEMALKRFAI